MSQEELQQQMREMKSFDEPMPQVGIFWYDRLRDVADPWYTGDFETTFQDILAGCEAMLGL